MIELVTWGGLLVSLVVAFYILWRPRSRESDPAFVKAVGQSIVGETTTEMDIDSLLSRAKSKRSRG